MSIRKQILEGKSACKVTFTIPKAIGKSAKTAFIAGEFNDWSASATPMKKNKTGAFSTTLTLETGHRYQFRYLLDQSHWENDPEADGYQDTPFRDSQNSVIYL